MFFAFYTLGFVFLNLFRAYRREKKHRPDWRRERMCGAIIFRAGGGGAGVCVWGASSEVITGRFSSLAGLRVAENPVRCTPSG